MTMHIIYTINYYHNLSEKYLKYNGIIIAIIIFRSIGSHEEFQLIITRLVNFDMLKKLSIAEYISIVYIYIDYV